MYKLPYSLRSCWIPCCYETSKALYISRFYVICNRQIWLFTVTSKPYGHIWIYCVYVPLIYCELLSQRSYSYFPVQFERHLNVKSGTRIATNFSVGLKLLCYYLQIRKMKYGLGSGGLILCPIIIFFCLREMINLQPQTYTVSVCKAVTYFDV
jgi:hypothetical protein